VTESPDLTVGAFSWSKKKFREGVGYVKNSSTFGVSQRSGKLKTTTMNHPPEHLDIIWKANLLNTEGMNHVRPFAIEVLKGNPMNEDFEGVFNMTVFERPSGKKYVVVDFA
jgi:hypothetical protein